VARRKNWIAGAVKHPGASKAAAAREGVSLTDWIAEHKGDSGTTGRRARLAATFRKMAK
jgi:hypothetical protein